MESSKPSLVAFAGEVVGVGKGVGVWVGASVGQVLGGLVDVAFSSVVVGVALVRLHGRLDPMFCVDSCLVNAKAEAAATITAAIINAKSIFL